MYLVQETPRAIQVANDSHSVTREWWLPRSLIDRLTKFPKGAPLTYQEIEFTLPAWKVEEAALWDFVK